MVKDDKKKRRLSTFVGPLAAVEESPNDDLKEKKKRREMRKSMAMGSPFASPAKASPMRATHSKLASSSRLSLAPQSLSEEQPLSNAQLTELYTNCIKMCSDNKINQKNSWSLNLIDYISDVVESKTGEMTNFQVASCALDASVKIYSHRVDSIHSSAYKVLGGLSRSDFSRDDESGEQDGEGGSKRKGARSNTRHVNTIESNVAALNVKKFDMEFDVDPLFRKTSAAFDEGGARGLLLNHLCVQNEANLIFDSNEAFDSNKDFGAESAEIDPTPLLSLLSNTPPGQLAKLEVCPQLKDFEFMGWSLDTDKDENDNSGSSNDSQTENAASSANSTPPGILDSSMGEGMLGGGMLSDDEEVGGFFADDYGGDDGDDDMMMCDGDSQAGSSASSSAYQTSAVAFGQAAANPSLGLALAGDENGSDYSYFSEKHLKNWAGPSHWRVRPVSIDKASNSGDGASKKKRAPKKAFQLEFELDRDWETLLGEGRAATVLSRTTEEKKDRQANLLPEDIHYTLTDLTKLFTKPKWTIKARSLASAVGDDDDNEDGFYDYNNANDVNNFCADMGGMDDDDDDDDFAGFQADRDHDNNSSAASALASGFSLVQQPRMVNKISIHYEKNAKKINVKQLKTKLWSELVEEPKQDDNIMASDEPKKPVQNIETAPAQPHNFSELVQDVPKKMPQTTAKNLSVPIMFVCLLHLANERSLRISSTHNMDDLNISQDTF